MCVLSDCVVRIETGVWVIHLHYVAYVPEMLSILLLWSGPRDHSAWAMGVACRGHWPLGTGHWALAVHRTFTVYRLRHRCPTARTDARPIPEGMTIVCLVALSIVVKRYVLAKNCLKERIGNQAQRVDFLGRRHISTSGFAYTATETAVFALYIVLMGTLKINIFR